ncbi:hypothetical protein NFI96_031335 [Prochilodus magdalenae]|nr:hypothetical protein NFI96_031335 [Prochilodus magdalenae]
MRIFEELAMRTAAVFTTCLSARPQRSCLYLFRVYGSEMLVQMCVEVNRLFVPKKQIRGSLPNASTKYEPCQIMLTSPAIQMLEDTPKVIKEEGIENDTWSSEEPAGQFPFEHQDSLPHNLAQQTHEEQNQLHEDMERPSTHFTCILPSSEPVKSDDDGLSKVTLQVKTEKEQEEDKEGQDIVDGSEQRIEQTGDHLEFTQRDAQLWQSSHEHGHDGEAEWTDKAFTSAQLSRDLAGFTQPVDNATEQSGDGTLMDVYSAGQVQKQLQASWCRERQSSSTVKQLNTQLTTPQHRRTSSRTGEIVPGANMRDQTETNMAAQAFLGYSRGGLNTAKRLRTHWRTNGSGERRFSCTFCERRFVRFGQLKEHLRSHTGERPYTCAQCGRSFTKQGNLIRHAVVHSGEKPYQCGLCGKCFTQRSSLKSHQKTHMPEREDVLQGLPVCQSGNSLSVTQSRGFV